MVKWPLLAATIAVCDSNHRVCREACAVKSATAEPIPGLAGGTANHSNMSKFCLKLIRLHADTRCPVRRLLLGVGNEGHLVTPSIWRGSNLSGFELDILGAKMCAGPKPVESTAGAVTRNLMHTTAGHKGRSAPSMSGATNEPAAAA
jgi:hypothetical protein